MNQALEWLEANEDKSLDELLAQTGSKGADDDEEEETNINVDQTGGGEMKSLVCNDCGKQFKNAELASYHATKRWVDGTLRIAFELDDDRR